MDKWIVNAIKKMQSANDLLTIKDVLIDIKEKLGFDYILYTVGIPNALTNISHFFIGDYPDKWLLRYIDKGYVKIDPVIKHCIHSQLGYCWDNLKESKDQEVVKFVNDAKDHGFVGGVSIGVSNHQGERSIISVASAEKIKNNSSEFYLTSLSLTALQPYIYEAINRLSLYKQPRDSMSTFTERELDCLLWSAEGKTSDEIAVILSIKTPTVVFHLKNIIKKLGVKNRNQAIAKAILFGYISPQYSSLTNPPAYQF